MINKTYQIFGTAFVIRFGFDESAAHLEDEIDLGGDGELACISTYTDNADWGSIETRISISYGPERETICHSTWKEARDYHKAVVSTVRLKRDQAPELADILARRRNRS